MTRIPLGRTGKKLEVPVKRIVQGATAESVASAGALQDPRSLDEYVDYATGTEGEGGRMSETLTVAILGTGVIGAAWATGFLATGHTVTAFDPADGAEAQVALPGRGQP